MRSCTLEDRRLSWRGAEWPRNRWKLKRLKRDTEAHALVKSIASVRRVPLYDLLDRRRGLAAVCETRQLAMYLVHVMLGWPQEDVARLFSRRRSTVAHACQIMEDLRDTPDVEGEIARIEARFALRAEEASHGH